MSTGSAGVPVVGAASGRLVLVRHGETEWSRTGRHTGTTDVPLTAHGEAQAARLRTRLAGRPFVLVATSPRLRTRHTADLAGLRPSERIPTNVATDVTHGPATGPATDLTTDTTTGTADAATGGRAGAEPALVARRETWDDLAEWDYGDYEGVTTPEIRRAVPGWTVFTAPVPGGETPEQVTARADAVIRRAAPFLERGDVAFVGHGHMLRVVVARWLGLDSSAGAMFVLDAGGLSELGYEHGTPAVLRLNESV